jgi:hypothetical protein
MSSNSISKYATAIIEGESYEIEYSIESGLVKQIETQKKLLIEGFSGGY